jgi:hypothetical protein
MLHDNRPRSAADMTGRNTIAVAGHSAGDNDGTVREAIWRRYAGDEWAAYDALPPAIRRRMQSHAYDPWSVNALMLWRLFHRQTACSRRAERRLLRHLEACEAQERAAFADLYRRTHGTELPHVAARADVLRAGCHGECRGGPAKDN